MLEIFGKKYYIDLDAITEKCKIQDKPKETPTKKRRKIKEETEDDFSEIFTTESEQQINIFKYELIKMCIQRIFDEIEETDEELGVFAGKNSTMSFRMAFNTLIKSEIIIELDDE